MVKTVWLIFKNLEVLLISVNGMQAGIMGGRLRPHCHGDQDESSNLRPLSSISWPLTSLQRQHTLCPTNRWIIDSARLECLLFVHSSLNKLVNMAFWKQINWFWCKLAQVVLGKWAWNDLLCGPGGQRSRSHEAEVRFGGLVEASFSTNLGRVAFLVRSERSFSVPNFQTPIFQFN